MMKFWIGLALLSGSWLFGLDYYEPADATACWGLQLAGILLISWASGTKITDAPSTQPSCCGTRRLLWAAIVLLLPVIPFAPWPYRTAPLAIVVGLAFRLIPNCSRCNRALSRGMVAAGLILFAQTVFLWLYESATARSHDLPWLGADLIAAAARLVGISAAADESSLIFQTARQAQHLAVTWDMVFDPVTGCFFIGGLATICIGAWSAATGTVRRKDLLGRIGCFAMIAIAWLPIRMLLLLAIYLHRAVRTEDAAPLHVMNQFFSPWVLLTLLAIPVVFAWKWIRISFEVDEGNIAERREEAVPAKNSSSTRRSSEGRAGLSMMPAIGCGLALIGAALVAIGLGWEPVGVRKQGRVKFVERHSPWSPTDRPYDTKTFGGDDESGSSYNYRLAYEYLGQYYQMSRIAESDSIDSASLANCDVLIIKIPKFRYTQEEVDAVVHFVEGGGSVLFVGDHTNLDSSSANMNDIARNFGFTFRHDVLYSTEPSPDEEAFVADRVPHPAIQHIPRFDFAVSCSIDPGWSSGRPIVEAGRLFSMPGDFHFANYMPYAEHLPEMRIGPFVQAWSTRYHQGRAAAWADSTIFSNFCIGQTGKAGVLLDLVEWLNHAGPGSTIWWLPVTLIGLIAVATGAWLLRFDRRTGLVLIASAACGWALGCESAAALNRQSMPLPKIERPLPLVMIDRNASQVPLANGAFNVDKQGQGYGLLEQWIPRIGCLTERAEGNDAFRGDALVVIAPSRAVSEDYCKRLVDYVSDGGRLIVIDEGDENVPSTSNQLLRPFGLSVQFQQPWSGWIVMKGQWPYAEIKAAWEVQGGERVGSLGGERTICATTRYGKGLVMAIGFGNLFNDASMGGDWMHHPNAVELLRFDTLFALLRLAILDQPIEAPLTSATPAETIPKASASKRTPRDMRPPQKGPK